MATMGKPAIARPNALELRALQQTIDQIRERFGGIESTVSALADTSTTRSSQASKDLASLQATLQRLGKRVTALEEAETGDGSTSTTFTAIEAITQGQPVRLSAAGQVKPIDPDDPTAAGPFIGIATGGAAAGGTVTLARAGDVADYPAGGLTPGRDVWATTSGVTQTPAGNAVHVGVAITGSAIAVGGAPPVLVLPDDPTGDPWLPVAYGVAQPAIELAQAFAASGGGLVAWDGVAPLFRSLQAGTSGITIDHADGIDGDPTISLHVDADMVEFTPGAASAWLVPPADVATALDMLAARDYGGGGGAGDAYALAYDPAAPSAWVPVPTNAGDALDTLQQSIDTLVGLMDAPHIAFTPASPSAWAGEPTNVADALDMLASGSVGGGGGLDAEGVRDTVAAFVASGGGLSIVHNDPANTLTFTNTDTGSDAVASHVADVNPHTQYVLGSGLDESIDDRVASLLNVTGAGITSSYDDPLGVLTIELSTALRALGGLTPAADALPYFNGTSSADVTTLSSFGRSLIDDADAAAARTTLGLVIGTNVQAYDAELAAIAGLTSAADRLPYFTGSGTAALATFSTFGRSLVDDADAAAARTTLGLGTMATQASSAYIPMPATPTTGYVLTWNGSAWVGAASAGGGVTDHGALTGLGDDDHAQYALTNGTRLIAAGQVIGASHATSTTYSPVLAILGTASNEPLQINSFTPNIVFFDRSTSAYNVRLLTNSATVDWSSDTSAAAGAWTTGQFWNLLTGAVTVTGTAPVLTLNNTGAGELLVDMSGGSVGAITLNTASGANAVLDFNANAGTAGGTGFVRINRSASNSTGGSGLRVHVPGSTSIMHRFEDTLAALCAQAQPLTIGGLTAITASGTSGLTVNTSADDLLIDSSGGNTGISFLNASGSGSSFILFGDNTSTARGRVQYNYSSNALIFGAGGNANAVNFTSTAATFNVAPAGYVEGAITAPGHSSLTNVSTTSSRILRYVRNGSAVTCMVSLSVTRTASGWSLRLALPVTAANTNGVGFGMVTGTGAAVVCTQATTGAMTLSCANDGLGAGTIATTVHVSFTYEV